MRFRFTIKGIAIHFFLLITLILFFSMLLSSTVYAQKLKRLSLIDCLYLALEQNPIIKSAQENLLKTRLQREEADASILPKISTSFENTYMDNTYSAIPMLSMPDENYSLSVNFQQPIYDQGRYPILKDQALFSIEMSQLGLEEARQGIIFGVISAYIKTLKASEMVTIAEESRDRLKEHLRVTERRYEVGQIAKNDVLRAEMELANAESDLIHARQGLSINNEYLQSLLHVEDEPFLAIPVEGMERETRGLEEMLRMAYEKRSDYLQARKREEFARLGISLAQKEYHPNISLFGQYQRTGESFFPKDDNFTIGCSVDLPIFEGGLRRINVSKARHDLTLSEFAEQDLKRRIRVEVVQAYLHIQDLNATLKAIDKQMEHAQENMRIVSLRYQEGAATNLDVLDANLLLVKARTDLTKTNSDIIEAEFGLIKETGELTIDKVKDSID